MNEQTPQAFRVGGMYLDGYGDVCRIYQVFDFGKQCCVEMLCPHGWEKYGFAFAFDSGRYMATIDDPDCDLDLIPGEVNEQGEPIAPTFYCAAETIKAGINKEYAQPWETLFPTTPAVVNRPGMKFVAKVPDGLSVTTADLHMVARDDKRVPLQSQSAGRYDPFKGFVVKRDTATPDHAYSHPLTRVADAGAQTNPKNGSAYLVEVHDAKSIFRAQI